ncbi:MAG: hypothetical protein Q9164_001709 [Protoblastenia rupestris]
MWKFPKLKGAENYKPWWKSIVSALKYESWFDVASLAVPRPQLPPNATPEQQQEYQIAQQEWEAINNKAAQMILFKCEERLAIDIEDEVLAYDMCNILKKKYQDSGFTARHITLQKLVRTTLSASEGDVDDYAYRIKQSAKELLSIGAKIDDWILVSFLLGNLESKYSNFVQRTVVTLNTNPDFDSICTQLLEMERISKRNEQQTALAAVQIKKPNKNPHHRNSRDHVRKPPQCKHCKSYKDRKPKLHWESNCWTLHPELKPPSVFYDTSKAR